MNDTTTTTTTTAAPPAWHNGVDAGVLSAWQNKGYDLSDPVKTTAMMWDQYSHLQRSVGMPAERVVYLPKDAADEAGIKSFRQKIGIPADAKEYSFDGVKFADGTELEAGFTDAMRGALHKAGVPRDAAGDLVKSVIKYLDDADAAEKTVATSKLDDQKKALKTSWGTRHDENLLAAKQGARRLGVDPETVNALENAIGYDKVMEMFRKVGAGTSEDTFHEGRNTGAPATAATAQARLDELKRDDAWQKRLFAGDATTAREFHALMEQIAGVVA